MEISLSNSCKLAIIDSEDWPLVSQVRTWSINKRGYVYGNCGQETWLLHKIVLHIFPGDIRLVDHINHDLLDCRKSQLRISNQSQNHANQRKTRGTSKYKGVSWDSHNCKWIAMICCNKKQINLGRYHSEIEAAKVYDKAAINLFGEFALLNFSNYHCRKTGLTPNS